MPLRDRIRWMRRYPFKLLELIWTAGYGLVGRLRPAGRAVRCWTSRGGARVLIIAPHPDDETVGAGGAALLHRRAADYVRVVVVTDGRNAGVRRLPREEMARRRASEIRAAADILGVNDLVCLDLPEGQWDLEDARTRLAPLLQEAHVIYAPSFVDYHPDHLKVARVVADLVTPDQTIRIYQIAVPLTALLVNLVADISAVTPAKERALAAFTTQTGALAPLARQARYQARRYRLPAAEVFWELPAAAYGRIMARRDGQGRYWGLRPYPLTDPLAALVGRQARLALRAATESVVAFESCQTMVR